MTIKNCDKFYILLLLQLFSVFDHGQAFVIDNSERVLGDPCDLKNNQVGTCSKIADCDYVKKLFDSKKYAEIERCYFAGGDPVVCCPKNSKNNKKFTDALCKNRKISLKLETNIINGKKAEVREFRHQVALGYRKAFESKLEFECGGSLIADDIVLTAAHCANKKDQIPVMVRLGRTSLDLNDKEDDSKVQDIDIQKIELHSSYSRNTRQNDIAMIKLKHPVQFSDSVEPICLSTRTANIPDKFTITGYGKIDPNRSDKSEWLLKGVVTEFPFAECQKKLQELGKSLINSQMCALNETGVDGCQGDSGGPMIYDDGVPYLYGIISYGNGCGSTFPGIYTRVDKFLNWIEEKMSLLA